MTTSIINIEWDKSCVCRCCLRTDHVQDISMETYGLENKDLFYMLEETFNIHNKHNISIHKQYVCEDCMAKLQAAIDFKSMVVQNEDAYFKYIQRHINERETNSLDLEKTVGNSEIEVVPENMKSNDDEYSFDDYEILANYKTVSDSTVKRQTRSSKNEGKPIKIKTQELQSNEDTRPKDLKKVLDHRGSGPILRGNSMKLLEHSTACVFQWNQSWYRCFCCKQPFSDIALLKAHTTKHHTLADIQRRIISQQNRLVKVDISTLNCNKCSVKLADLNDLTSHLSSHGIIVSDHLLVPFRVDKNLACQICFEPFSLFRLLNIHMNRHYQKYVCYICGAGFSNLVFLNLHRSRSHRPILCQACGVTFQCKTDKKQHDIDVHGVKFERKRRFPCPYCPERFLQENWRVKHMVDKHDMIKPEFRCDYCSKSYITKSLRNNHVKIVHMKERKHECDVCHKFFYTKSDVARHRVTHTGEKNFFCSMCNNPFASKDSLTRHMKRTHIQ